MKFKNSQAAKIGLVGLSMLVTGPNAFADASISGHVAYDIVDRDSVKDIDFARHGFSESRFRIVLDKELDSGLKVGVVQEFGIAEGEGALDTRRQEILIGGSFGGIRFGQGNDAGDGVVNGDLSGTALIQAMASNASNVGYSSKNYNGFDPGRGERLRYDSPKLAGMVIISAQLGEKSQNEIAIKFKKKLGAGNQIRAGLFVSDSGNDDAGIAVDKDSSGFAVSYLHDSGFNISFASAKKDNAAGAGLDGDFEAFKLGYKTGKHALSYISGTSENPANAVETDSSGIAYVYTLAKGVEMYATIHEFDSDNDAVDEDFTVAGMRVKF